MSSSVAFLIAAALAAVLVFRRDRSAFGDETSNDLPPLTNDPPAWGDLPIPDVQIESPEQANLSAFLYAIRRSEHLAADVASGRDYGLTFGRTPIGDFSDHPTATGEWMGRTLDAAMCRAAGLRVGCKSTAAGAYQIIRPTWEAVRRAGSWGDALTDFSPASQDEAARRILIRCGALSAVESGDLDRALALASREWASLPGSRAGQPQRSASDFLAFFNEGLRVG